MEHINNRHNYDQIDSDKIEIRVLQLHAGKCNDGIRGTLFRALCDANIAYHALSYMWGDPQATSEIEIDDNRHFRVTKNAESALRDLRHEHDDLNLWIDTICIDQHNIQERNRQVKLMRQIYQNALIVHIWLDTVEGEKAVPHAKI